MTNHEPSLFLKTRFLNTPPRTFVGFKPARADARKRKLFKASRVKEEQTKRTEFSRRVSPDVTAFENERRFDSFRFVSIRSSHVEAYLLFDLRAMASTSTISASRRGMTRFAALVLFTSLAIVSVDAQTNDCVTAVPQASSFDLGYGREFNLTSRGTSVTYFIGYEEYVRYDNVSTNWNTVLVDQACPGPPPPAPPPPAPPPPALASVSAEMSLTGYSATTFGVSEQEDFKRGVAAYLDEDVDAITIISFSDVTTAPSGRRRRLQSTSSTLSVQFSVNVADYTRATNVASALDPSTSSSSSSNTTSQYSSTNLLNSLYVMGLRSATSVALTNTPGLATPPPPPPSPPPPSPPPTCGNGVFDENGINPDGSTGETCDPYGNSALNAVVPGCDPNTCQTLENWQCDETSKIGTPDYNCTCNNPVGVYAVVEEDCAQTTCTYGERCLANGLGCAPGAGGNACDRCLTAADVNALGPTTSLSKAGYYKVGQSCEVCPATSAGQIFAAAAVVVILAFFGFKASQVMGAQATNNMKKIVESLQFFSLSLSMDIKWPGPVINLGKYLEAFTFSIEFLRPECVATGLNWLNIFLASVFFVPIFIFLIIVVNDWRARKRYDRTVKAIHSEKTDDGETSLFWIEQPGYLWGTKRAFVSKGGDKIVKELQRQYRFRSSLRSFGVLSMTVLYLPIVRMCLQSYDCVVIDGVEGLRLEHDIDIDCESPTHQTIQATASIMLAIVGLGMPLYVIRQVRKIRLAGKLDDPRTLDSYGPFYDIYRRDELTQAEKLEIAQIRKRVGEEDDAEDDNARDDVEEGEEDVDGVADDPEAEYRTLAKLEEEEDDDVEHGAEEENAEDDDDDAASKKRPMTLSRALTMSKSALGRSPSARARKRAEKMPMKDRFALYYLSIELFQKSSVIFATSPLVAETALSGWGLVFVHWFIGVFVYVCQPWRIITLGFGKKFKVPNALNKVEASAGFFQGIGPALAMVFPVRRDEFGVVQEDLTFSAITVFLTVVITGLLTVRVVVFVGERLATKRKKMDIEKDPEESMTNVRKHLVELAKSGAIVSLFAFKSDFDIKRRKARARLEDTRHAMLLRVDDLKQRKKKTEGKNSDSEDDDQDDDTNNLDEKITALYEVANEMAHVVNAILPEAPREGAPSAEERGEECREHLKALLVVERERVYDESIDPFAARHEKAMRISLVVYAHDCAMLRLENHMREYAATESVSDLAVLGRAYRAFKNAQCNLYCDETWLSTSKISKNGDDGDEGDAADSSFGAALVQNVRFGDEELRVAKNAVRSKETLERLRDSAIADDVDGIFALVHDVNDVIESHLEWKEQQMAFFESIVRVDEDDDEEEEEETSNEEAQNQPKPFSIRNVFRKRKVSKNSKDEAHRPPRYMLDVTKDESTAANLSRDVVFSECIQALKTHESNIDVFTKKCVSDWLAAFKNLGRVKYTAAFAEHVRQQVELDIGGKTTPEEAKRVFDELDAFTKDFASWCDEGIAKIDAVLDRDDDDEQVARRFRAFFVASRKSLETVRKEALRQGRLAKHAREAVHKLVEKKRLADAARGEKNEAFEAIKVELENALETRRARIASIAQKRTEKLDEARSKTNVEMKQIDDALDVQISSLQEEITLKEEYLRALREARRREIREEGTLAKTTFLSAAAHAVKSSMMTSPEMDETSKKIRELKSQIKQEKRNAMDAKKSLERALKEEELESKKLTKRENAELDALRVSTSKSIQREALKVGALDETDVEARRAEMDAVKAVRRQQLAAMRTVQIEDAVGKRVESEVARALGKEMLELERAAVGGGVWALQSSQD